MASYLLIAWRNLPAGLLGRHSWDEANYLDVVAYSRTDFLHFYPDFDPNRVDYNGAFLVYWPVLVVRGLMSKATFDPLAVGRAIDLYVTLLTAILVYLLLNEVDRVRAAEPNRLKSAAGSVVFLLAPVTLWYGDKYKLEPMVLAFATLAFYVYLRSRRYSSTKRELWASAGAFLFGTALSIKSVYIFAAPALFVDLVVPVFVGVNYRRQRVANIRRAALWSMARLTALTVGASWPFLVIDIGLMLSGQQAVAHMFFIDRIRDFSSHTSYFDPHLGSVLVDFLHNTLVGALSVYALFGVVGLSALHLRREPFLAIWFSSLIGLTLVYAVIALPHNSSHDYHAYYLLLPLLVGFKLWPMGARTLAAVVPLVALANLGLADASYGLFSHQYSDPNGNPQAIQAGQLLKRIYTSERLQGTYVLSDSPVVAYYAEAPSFDYNDLYIYRGSGHYDQFGIGSNCRSFFLAAQQYRPISLIYLDPNAVLDYYADAQPQADLAWCHAYIASHFRLLTTTSLGQPIYIATPSGRS